MTKLAIFGGKKIRTKPFPYPPFPIIGKKEKQAVINALNKGALATFAGSPGPDYLGSGFAKKLEQSFCSYYGTNYAISTDSGTAALHVAVAAAGIGYGDEVIVTPWSFTSSAKAPLFHNAIPVFADIEDKTFGLDPTAVEKAITKYTKAIIVVHLFGHPARMTEIIRIAKKHKLIVIEDCAQAHGAMYKGKKVGTIGDIGIFSLDATKQITAGVGGMVITNNSNLAKRSQLMRNHGEVWGPYKNKKEMIGILGWGYIMDEMSAALGLAQMKKIDSDFIKRNHIAKELDKGLSKFYFLQLPTVEKDCTHSYYVYALKFNQKIAKVSRDKFVKALNAEGIPARAGYVEPLYLNPVYKWKVFYGQKGFPYSCHPRKIEYKKGDCPVAERLHLKEEITTMWTHGAVGNREIKDILRAVEKIADNIKELK